MLNSAILFQVQTVEK